MDFKAIGLALVAIVIAIFAVFHHGSTTSPFGATGTGPGCGGSVTCLSGDLYASASITGNTLVSLSTILSPSTFYLGGATTATSLPLVGARTSYTAATTTPCAIQSPAATSTLVMASALFTVSSTTASTVTIAKAATAFATTTVLGNAIAVGANAQATIVATSTTANQLAQDFVFAPSQWVVIGMAGNIGTFSPSGQCSAFFATN